MYVCMACKDPAARAGRQATEYSYCTAAAAAAASAAQYYQAASASAAKLNREAIYDVLYYVQLPYDLYGSAGSLRDRHLLGTDIGQNSTSHSGKKQ